MVGEAEIEQFSSDYKKVGGMRIAHSIVTYTNGQEYTRITISNVRVNTGLDDSLSKMK
jgi:outer membrane lipoprotein-sorting protein